MSTPAPYRSIGASQIPLASGRRDVPASRLPTKTSALSTASFHASPLASAPTLISKDRETGRAKLRRKNVPDSVLPTSIRGQSQERTRKDSSHPENSRSRNSPFEETRPHYPLYVSVSERQEQQTSSRTLRRKQSVIGHYVSRAKITQPSQQEEYVHSAVSSQENFSSAPLSFESFSASGSSVNVDARAREPVHNDSTSQIHEFYYQNNPTVQTRTPISATSATPSLHYSESSGAFSHANTPTSRTSHSPLIHSSPHLGLYTWASPGKSSLEYDTRSHIRLRSDSFASADDRPGSSGPSPIGLVPLTGMPRTKTPQTSMSTSIPALQRGLAESALPRTTTSSQPALKLSNLSTPGHATSSPTVSTQRPPELAHLMDSQPDAGQQAPEVPARPNNEGIRLPLVHTTPSPVIHSNLPRLDTSRHRRQSSSSNHESAISSAGSSQKPPSSRPSVTSPQQQASKDVLLVSLTDSEKTPVARVSERSIPSPSKDPLPRTVSPNVAAPPAKSGSRFGFFSRKSKQSKEPKSQENVKLSKKGPVAGTGHEGYGKYAITARNGGPSAPSSRSSSRSTSASPDDRVLDPKAKPMESTGIDDFLTSRLNPVYIRGDGSASSFEITSNQAFPSTTTAGGDNDEPRADLPQSTSQSTRPVAAQHGNPVKWNRSESTDASSAMSRDSLDQDISADERKGAHWQVFSKPSSTPKPANKWNFFHRGQRGDMSDLNESSQPAGAHDQNPVRPIAHYAMLGGEGRAAIEDLQSLMQEVDATRSSSIDTNYLSPGHRLGSAWSESRTSFEMNTSASNSAIDLSPQVSSTDLSSQAAATAAATAVSPPNPTTVPKHNTVVYPSVPTPSEPQPRPSRLAQVGRIPPVVSHRDRVRRPSDQSFSRPFLTTPPQHRPDQPSSEQPPAAAHENDPSPAQAMDPLQALPMDTSLETRPSDPVNLTSSELVTSSIPRPREFMSISPRKNSEISESSGSISLYFPTAATTAVIPSATSPRSDDEVWEEYDDLIDDVLTPGTPAAAKHDFFDDSKQSSPSKTPASVAKGKTLFPNLASMARELRPESTLQEKRSQSSMERATANVAEPEELTADRTSGKLIKIERRSLKSLRDSGSSTKSQAFDLLLADRMGTTDKKQDRIDNVMQDLRNFGESTTKTKSVHMKFDAQSMTNLRFGALMTSKWLSFGRVLFSPAHFELNNLNEDRVLVIDGLGKDWSFYCALTYSNASIYCLGPPLAKTANRNSLGSWQSLPNYRYFTHPDLSANFPFPKNFFAAVVLRFPVATSDAKLKATVAECKRVLRPGGYIEISTLDLDLTNMGNRCRRAVRTLKMQMHTAVPEVSLKPISDNIQHMLGRRGFENLNRCMVGLPAAGAISDSREQSVDGNDPSFTDLMKDQTREGDEGITKMVARVGRWWYSRCYESAVLPNGDLSMSLWNDIVLLRECEKRQTAFKLFSCYAQKPTVAKRRTVSL